MALRFARPARRDDNNQPEYLFFRAQDVIAISGTSMEEHSIEVIAALDNLLALIQSVEGGLMYQGRFTPATGLDGDGNPIPEPGAGNRGWFWIASAAGTWTPPGGTSTVFNVGDWLVSSGARYDVIAAAQVNVLQTILTGFAANNAAIVATDTLLQAINKAQGQINNRAPLNTTLTNAAGANTLPATTSTSLTGLLQTVRNCLRWLTERFTGTSATRAVTADALTTPRAINGVNFDGSAPITIPVGDTNPGLINQTNAEAGTGTAAAGWSAQRVRQAVQAGAVPHGESATAAGTAAKEAAVAQFTRVTGRLVYINFTVTNTAATPTLNINGTGAANIWLGGVNIGTGLVAGGYLLRFNGTQYEILNTMPSNANPLMNNAVSQGSSPRYSRQDHVHPVDTSRAPNSHVGTGGGAHANVVAGGNAGFITGADKTKLDGITAGAQPNAVTSVFGRTGAVTGGPGDVGLANVTNVAQAPATHVAARGTAQHALAGGTDTTAGFSQANFTQTEKNKLAGVADNANNTPAAVNNLTSTSATAPLAANQGRVLNEAVAQNRSEDGVLVCSTAAATAAKTVALTGYTRTADRILWIRFTIANTAATPTLNVNSTGAAGIRVGGVTLNNAGVSRQIAANIVYGFVWNSTDLVWDMIIPATTLPTAGITYGSSTTAAGTAAKAVTLAGFVRRTGSIVGINFTTANTAANPTLNVNSTGAANIRMGTTATTDNIPPRAITNNRTHFFMFDGTAWQLINPVVVDAAFVANETEMSALNLRPSAIVFVEVSNTSISSTSYEPRPVEEFEFIPTEGNEIESEKEGDADEYI